jgi:hypothetical protein
MKTVFYSRDACFELTDDEFNSFIRQAAGKKVWIPRLEVFLSDMFIWAGKKPQDNSKRILHDGTRAINKFGQWYLENNPDVRIDEKFYPELNKDYDPLSPHSKNAIEA